MTSAKGDLRPASYELAVLRNSRRGESTNGEDAADAGAAAGSTAPMTRGAGNAALGVELEAEWRRKASGIVIQELTQEVKRHRDQSIGYRGHGE